MPRRLALACALGACLVALPSAWHGRAGPADPTPTDARPSATPELALAPALAAAPRPEFVTRPFRRVTVRGRVLGPDGRPRALARVAAGDAETRTDDDGSFRLEVLPGPVEISASSSEGMRAELDGDATTLVDVRLTLLEARPLDGTVLGPDGLPVAGAQVTAWAPGYGRATTTTAGDGTYHLDGVPLGRGFQLGVEAGDHGRTSLSDLVWAPGVRVDPTLPPTRVLRGRLVRAREDGTREGVGGVRVLFTYGVGGCRGGVCWDGVATDGPGTTTEEDGSFACPGISRGYRVRVQSDLWGTDEAVDCPRDGPAEILVSPRAVLRGVAVGADGAPAADAEVRFSGRRGSPQRTGADGAFVLGGGVPDGAGCVTVMAERGDEAGTLLVAEAALRGGRPVVVRMAPAPAIEGLVLDEAGAPIEGAFVEVYRRSDDVREIEGLEQTDAAGRYRLRRLPASPLCMEVVAAGFGRWELEGVLPSAPASSLPPVVLARKPRRAGRVVDESGAPVTTLEAEPGSVEALPDGRYAIVPSNPWTTLRAPGFVTQQDLGPEAFEGQGEWVVVMRRARVVAGRLLDLSDRPVRGAYVAVRGPAWRSRYGADVRTDIAGGFRLEVPYDGRYRILVEAEGLSFPFDAWADADGPVAVVRAVRPRTVAGRLVGPDGRGLPGVEISAGIAAEEGSIRTAATDADGGFQIEGLALERVDLWADGAKGLPPGLVVPDMSGVETDAGELVVVAGPGRTIEGRVLRPDGSAASGSDVEARLDGRRPWTASATADAEGRFHLEGLRPGKYGITVSDFAGRDDSPVYEGTLEGVVAGAQDVVVPLQPAAADDDSDR